MAFRVELKFGGSPSASPLPLHETVATLLPAFADTEPGSAGYGP
jgi:hypothetical protein